MKHDLIKKQYSDSPNVDILELSDARKIAIDTNDWNGEKYGNCWFVGKENEPSFELKPLFKDDEEVGFESSVSDDYGVYEYLWM